MTIKEQYKKVRAAYMERVRYYRNRGYIIETIPIPKKITRGSIRRLERQTGKYITKHAVGFQRFLTGKSLAHISKSERQSISRENLEFKKLKPEEQSISRSVGNIVKIDAMSESTLSLTDSYEQIIDNWYSTIEGYRTDIYRRIEMRTNELIEGKDAETRKKFAYVLYQNPDLFPTMEDSTTEIIDIKMSNVMHVMDIASGSEAYYDFLRQFDTVESEE